MTHLEALIDLRDKVKAGDDDGVLSCSYGVADHAGNRGWYVFIVDAFRGSLDAAKALHEAVLPGWDWALGMCGASVYDPRDNSPYDCDGCQSDNPARAWLLAILEVLIAQEVEA